MMLTQSQQKQKQLYETDYHLWVLETVKQLQNGDFEAVDWENLIDEVSDLSQRDQQKPKLICLGSLGHWLSWIRPAQLNLGDEPRIPRL